MTKVRAAAHEMRAVRTKARKAVAKLVEEIADGKQVSKERLAELSMMDLAVIAFDMSEKEKPSPRERINAHQIIQERLLGKPTQKTESESTNRFVFEGPDWWFKRKELDEPGSPRELPPAA